MTDLEDPLLCPICLETFVAEIYQCENGHCICSRCITNLLECPQCKIPYAEGKIRNRAFEALLDTLKFSCPYEKRGCTQQVKRGYKDYHARKCLFKVIPVNVSLHTEPDAGQNLNSANSNTGTSKNLISKLKHACAEFMNLDLIMDFIPCKWLAIALMILCYHGVISVITLFLCCFIILLIAFVPK